MCIFKFFPGGPVPEYELPFQKEAGVKPTFQVMQSLVGRKKARPLFPDVWKQNDSTVRVLKETMGECWDADAEARLTAKCVFERLSDLASSMGPRCITNNLESSASDNRETTVASAPLEASPDESEETFESMMLLAGVDGEFFWCNGAI